MQSNYRHLIFSDNFMLCCSTHLSVAHYIININRQNRECKSPNNETDGSDVFA